DSASRKDERSLSYPASGDLDAWLPRTGSALSRHPDARTRTARRRLQAERIRDAGESICRRPYIPGGFAEFCAARFREALRGLHRAAAPDFARPEPDH